MAGALLFALSPLGKDWGSGRSCEALHWDVLELKQSIATSTSSRGRPLTPTLFLTPQSRAVHGPSPCPGGEREQSLLKAE
jgi:hypothetical protein